MHALARRLTSAVLVLTASLLSTACRDSSSGPPMTEAGVACLDASCRTVTRLITIPDAENLMFAPDGRLFVTGEFAYEIVRDPDTGAYSAPRIDGDSCGFPNEYLGLAMRGDVLYTLCNNQLWAATMDADIVLRPIHTLNMGLPNGMTSDDQGRLYITDGPTTMSPQIQRVVLDPGDPFSVVEQALWSNEGLEFPNGIAFDGSDFYLADASSSGSAGLIKRIPLMADGSAGAPVVIYEHAGVLDDLSVLNAQELIVSDFTNGRIFVVSKSGELGASSATASVVAASAVVQAREPLFSSDDFLVTDKGVLGERLSTNGNALVLFESSPTP